MERKALSGEEAEFVGELCQYVRGHLASFAEAGKRMDERYSAAAFRQRHEAEIERFRAARAKPFDHVLNECVETGEPMYGADTIQSVTNGFLPQKPGHRMGAAMDECASVQLDVDLDTERAELVCLLTWLAWDEYAHTVQPHVCEFQSMQWLWDPARTDINRRQVQHDRITSSWVTLARRSLSRVKLRPVANQPRLPIVAAESEASDLPPADRWLRDRAHLVAANLPLWRAMIEEEERGIRARWKAERMMRVRDRKHDLRLDVEHHAELLPPPGERAGYFRQQLRRELEVPDNVHDALRMASAEAIESARTMFNGRPFTRSFASWVEFLLFVILSESANESERVSVLQSLSNEWPGRQRLLIDFKHNGVLSQLLKLDARAWVVVSLLVPLGEGDLGANAATNSRRPSLTGAPGHAAGDQRSTRNASDDLRVEVCTNKFIIVEGFVPGVGRSAAQIRGLALCELFGIVRDLSDGCWESKPVTIRQIEVRLASSGKLRTPKTLRDYANRIRRELTERGLGHLWLVDAGAGITWRGPK